MMSTSAASDKRGMDMQVLVATMGQSNFDLVEKMNLDANAIIANQCGCWNYAELENAPCRVQMISTPTRGVGINRNLALQLSTAEFLLFADDDIRYYDGALQAVQDAFRQLPEADVIFFGIDMTKNGVVFDRRRNKVRRLHLWNSLRYGACRMAVRREAIVKKRIGFSTLFGGGCLYCSGEDTIFIRDCFKAGLKLYAHDAVLGACAKDASTWFTGFDDKYFHDRGAMLACAFPHMKHLIKWYYVLKLHRKSGAKAGTILRQMNRGISAFDALIPYQAEEKLQDAQG